MLIKELEATHEDAHPELFTPYQDFYQGGHEFEKRKDNYLRFRAIEKVPGAGAHYRKQRLEAAHYANHVGGIADNFIGTANTAPLCIEVGDNDDERAEYWRSLNTNVDGCHRTPESIAWSMLCDLFVHRRAYLTINTAAAVALPPGATQAQRKAAEKARGPKAEPRFSFLDCKHVLDWEHDEEEELLWVRTHHVSYERAGELGPRNIEVHCWAYHKRDEILEFYARKKISENFKETDTATAGEPRKHSLGICPIIPVEVPPEFWLMDRMFSTAKAFFNREAAREYALDSGALNLPCLKGANKPEGVTLHELGVIWLGADGDFFWRSPDGVVYEALAKDCDYLLGSLYSTLHSLSLHAADLERQSGAAKMQDKGPLNSLMRMLAFPVRASFTRGCTAIAKMRKEEDLKPVCKGMDEYDVQALELELNRNKVFVETPGMMASAKSKANLRLAKAFLAGELNAEDLKKLQAEAEDGDTVDIAAIGRIALALQQLALARERAISSGDTELGDEIEARMTALMLKIPRSAPTPSKATTQPTKIRNPKTGEPSGFEPSAVRMKATTPK